MGTTRSPSKEHGLSSPSTEEDENRRIFLGKTDTSIATRPQIQSHAYEATCPTPNTPQLPWNLQVITTFTDVQGTIKADMSWTRHAQVTHE